MLITAFSAASGASAEFTKTEVAPRISAGSGRCMPLSRPETLRSSNQVATLETAKAEFEAGWKQWKTWAKMEEVA
jgi:hypothetical protein